MASTTPSTAPSRSASSNTTKGDLPPSSSESFLPVPAVASRMMRPTSVEPVKAILSIPGWRTISSPVRPSPVRMLTTPGGQPRVAADLGESEGRERRELGGLDHHRIAHGEGRRDLPGQHQEREVPGDDLPRRPPPARSPAARSPSAAPSRRGGRSAGPPAERRCRASRGWACRCPASPARRAGGRSSGPAARARRGGGRGRGRPAPTSGP